MIDGELRFQFMGLWAMLAAHFAGVHRTTAAVVCAAVAAYNLVFIVTGEPKS